MKAMMEYGVDDKPITATTVVDTLRGTNAAILRKHCSIIASAFVVAGFNCVCRTKRFSIKARENCQNVEHRPRS